MKKYLPYIIIFCSFIFAGIIFFFVADWFVMPWLIHGGKIVKVPDVIGKTIPEAERILSDNNLSYAKSSEQFNDKFPPNCVINQIPKAGIEVKTGRCIYYIASKGQENVNTPNLTGKSLREARVLLIRANLQMGDILYLHSDSIGVDTVIRQTISAGRPMPAGSMINVVVSKGNDNLVKVPNLIGISIGEAQSLLQESGLVLGAVSYAKSETYVTSTVLSQTPGAGNLVASKSAVNLVITK